MYDAGYGTKELRETARTIMIAVIWLDPSTSTATDVLVLNIVRQLHGRLCVSSYSMFSAQLASGIRQVNRSTMKLFQPTITKVTFGSTAAQMLMLYERHTDSGDLEGSTHFMPCLNGLTG